MPSSQFRYTPEMIEFIKANVKGRNTYELTDMFNAKFGTDRNRGHIKSFLGNYKLSNGVDSRFPPDFVPPNKGKKKTWAGGEETQFKKGHRPKNYMPVGSERVSSVGYVDIKIADPDKWRGKHLIMWESYNDRPVPDNHVVIFGDGNRFNFDKENLILLTRGQLAVMNRKGLISNNIEVTKTGIIMADIFMKMSKLKGKG